MAERQMDVETMLGGLNDIRLPPEAAGGLMADLLVAIGMGLALAWAVSVVVTARRTQTDPTQTLDMQIDALRHLPDDERSVALMHLARAQGIALPPQASLYGPEGFPPAHDIEARLRDRQGAHA